MQAKIIGGIIALSILVSALIVIIQPKTNLNQTTKIGLVLPIQHQALTDIVNGFEKKLASLSPQPIQFEIKNAQGDINIQHSIIQSFNMNPDIKLVVPIGTTATEMAMRMVKNKPILAIAAQLTEQQRQQSPNQAITALIDEFPPEKTLQLIQKVQPQLTNLTVIYSSDPKIYSTIQKLDALVKTDYPEIKLKKILVTQLSDLYTITQRIKTDTQGVLIFKDSLIVSGINTLAKKVSELQIPLITSDQGSVSNGATYALGVSEQQIGIEAAPIAQTILSGEKTAQQIPLQYMSKPRVFYNHMALQKAHIKLPKLRTATHHLNYQLEDTTTHG